MDIPEVPKVFFIRGVFKYTARSIQEVIEARPPTDALTPMLKAFEDWRDADWIAQRQVRCATCPRLVGTERVPKPIFIPENLEKCKLGFRWKCHDTVRFCSWPCAQYHILHQLSNDNRYTLLLKHLCEKWTGGTVDEIAVSTNPWRCQSLGGDLLEEDFHRINEFNMQRLQSSFDEPEAPEDDDEYGDE